MDANIEASNDKLDESVGLKEATIAAIKEDIAADKATR